MEDGFVRSVGLGVDLIKPLSLVLDKTGIYYDATAPSGLEQILNTAPQFSPALLQQAQQLRQKLIELKLSKYNVGGTINLDLPSDKKIILVPGQVETDASILKSSFDIKTNLALLEAVRKENPQAFIIYKPHPDVVAGSRHGKIQQSLADMELTDGNMAELLDYIDEVHTITSLTGFEALLRKIKVVTYGMPFYAGWGLTEDHYECERRHQKLSLAELIAGTLIKYPTYIHPQKNKICSVDVVIDFLAEQKKVQKTRLPLKIKLIRFFKKPF
jgi:capsular polysaccharide export protein